MGFLRQSSAIYSSRLLHNHQLFSQSNLVSDDQPGHLNAQVPGCKPDQRPWGVAFRSDGALLGQRQRHRHRDGLFGQPNDPDLTTADPLVVTIAPPAGGTGPASPTGIVFNTDQTGFMVNGKSATFIMDTEDGTISAWNGGSKTTLEVDNSNNAAHGDNTVPPAKGIGAVYKGLAIGTVDGNTLLYTSNFRHGTVDVFNDKFQQVQSLTDGNLPPGYAPFNVQVLKGDLFVTFAKQDQFKHDDVAGAGNGFVDEFSLGGQLLARVASQGPQLNSPWGLGGRSRRPISASLPATFSSAISAMARSTPST